MQLFTKWLSRNFEVGFWLTALVVLYNLPVEKTETSLCVFTWLGFGHCPGCGIGHAIHDVLHLALAASFRHHPMGIFAVIVIFIRIKQLLYQPNKPLHEAKPHSSYPFY